MRAWPRLAAPGRARRRPRAAVRPLAVVPAAAGPEIVGHDEHLTGAGLVGGICS